MSWRTGDHAASFSSGAAVALATSATTVMDIVEGHLELIAQYDGGLSAFIHVMADAARRQAEMLDSLDPAARGPLHGMIISVKDIIDVEGTATTCGSLSRLESFPAKDAALVERLRGAGAVIIGKANCHEFAFGGPAFDLPFPPARNPWNSDLFPGGSSSGSGVSVAAGFCHASVGSDTAGSIRLPSSHCGIVGLKCSKDRIPLDGIAPLSHSLDSVGPMARSVSDCAALFQVMAGNGPAPHPVTGPLSLGIPQTQWMQELECQADVLAAFQKACCAFEAAGVELRTIPLPPLSEIHAASGVVMMREVAEHYADEVRRRYSLFGEVFRNRALLGERISNQHYRAALALCADFSAELEMTLRDVSAVVLPAYPVGPLPLVTVDKFYFLARPNLNAIANCAGLPTLSLPVMRDEARRPLGIQLMVGREDETRLLAVGGHLESLLAYPHQIPFADGHIGH